MHAVSYSILMNGIHVHLPSELHVFLMCSPTTTGHKWKKTCVIIICVLLVIGGVFGAVIGVSWWLGRS